jgi:hypothetical protein
MPRLRSVQVINTMLHILLPLKSKFLFVLLQLKEWKFQLTLIMTLTRFYTQTLHTSAVNCCNGNDKNTFGLKEAYCFSVRVHIIYLCSVTMTVLSLHINKRKSCCWIIYLSVGRVKKPEHLVLVCSSNSEVLHTVPPYWSGLTLINKSINL